MTDKKLKMYIIVKRSIPIGLGVNAVGHTSLACYLKFKDDPVLQEWLTSKHFRKVTCIVTDEQFEKAKKYPDFVIMTENAIGDAEVAMGFKPREEWPEFFKSLKLFGSHVQLTQKIESEIFEEKIKKQETHVDNEQCRCVLCNGGIP